MPLSSNYVQRSGGFYNANTGDGQYSKDSDGVYTFLASGDALPVGERFLVDF